jgi:hypothetical protein
VPSAGNESAMTRAPHVRNRATTGTPLGLTRARQQIQGQRCLLDFRRSPSGIAPASASAGTYLPLVPDLPSRVRSSIGPHRLDSDPDGPRTHFPWVYAQGALSAVYALEALSADREGRVSDPSGNLGRRGWELVKGWDSRSDR